MHNNKVMLITGTRKGIGRYLAEYYVNKGFIVIGCSRLSIDYKLDNYRHFCLDISDEKAVRLMFADIAKTNKRLDALINNAGIASMNHALLTPMSTVHNVINTNFIGTFLMCREAAKIMKKNNQGRIVNFATIATPMKLEGEAIYASSKAAVITLTQILAKEVSSFGVTVNAIGPTPIETDLIRSVPREKIEELLNRQAIKRYGLMSDISNVIDFFISNESNFITGQVLYLGGVN